MRASRAMAAEPVANTRYRQLDMPCRDAYEKNQNGQMQILNKCDLRNIGDFLAGVFLSWCQLLRA